MLSRWRGEKEAQDKSSFSQQEASPLETLTLEGLFQYLPELYPNPGRTDYYYLDWHRLPPLGLSE